MTGQATSDNAGVGFLRRLRLSGTTRREGCRGMLTEGPMSSIRPNERLDAYVSCPPVNVGKREESDECWMRDFVKAL